MSAPPEQRESGVAVAAGRSSQLARRVDGVFISYRRDDCIAHAGRLYDRLAERFGEDAVFMDLTAIAPGMDFVVRIEEAISSCQLFIALIGDEWVEISDRRGRRRLDDPDDPVRLEITAALRRSDLVVIPVLVEGATMPRAEQLPDNLKPLARRNAHVLTDARWRSNVDELIQFAEGVLPSGSQAQPHPTEQTEHGSAGGTVPADHVAGRTAGPKYLRWLFPLGVSLRPGRIATTIATVISFAVTAIGLILGLWTALKPDEPPATKSATLAIETLDRTSFGQSLDRRALPRSGYPRAQLERAGALVGIGLRVTGHKGKSLPLQWRLIDARTGEQRGQSRDVSYIPEADRDQNSVSIWVAVPPGHDRRFFIEVELLDDRGAVPLGRVRTERFRGT